jgi:DNA-directed RNA polymerase II subunit RPB3
MSYRPKSKYEDWEEGPQEGEVFDYDAVPEKFYFEVESAGNLEPDQIIQGGIKVLQNKLAAVLMDLRGDGSKSKDDYDGGMRSPDVDMNGGWQDQGYTTPYGNDAAANGGGAWGAGNGSTTPYGATPYGQSGPTGW